MDEKIFKFLKQLTENNTREWFNAHKEQYDEARSAFLEAVAATIQQLSKTNPGYLHVRPADCVFRIYRDVRFSKDKSPYKTHFGAYISTGGRKSPVAGHYVHVEPGNSFLAGGVYSPDPVHLKAVRAEIYFNPDEFLAIVNQPDFVSFFGELSGDRLKNPPAGFDKDSPVIDYLKFKSFVVIHAVSDEEIFQSHFPDDYIKIMEAINPLNTFLNRGIANKLGETAY
ncbi:MAG: DUF2461 domain-containing protein [Bacteroidetes bacterium]|nr:DUF2461 domain-containing protein [Bacteroidota bacterium]